MLGNRNNSCKVIVAMIAIAIAIVIVIVVVIVAMFFVSAVRSAGGQSDTTKCSVAILAQDEVSAPPPRLQQAGLEAEGSAAIPEAIWAPSDPCRYGLQWHRGSHRGLVADTPCKEEEGYREARVQL